MKGLLAIGLLVAASCGDDDSGNDGLPEDLVVDSDRIFLDSDDVDSDVSSDDILDDFMDDVPPPFDAPSGAIFLSESVVDFGVVPVGGMPALRIVDVFNNSPTDVLVGQIDVVGPGFRIDETSCGTLLLSGSSCGLLLTAAPETLGEQIGDLLVRTEVVTLFASLRVIGIR